MDRAYYVYCCTMNGYGDTDGGRSFNVSLYTIKSLHLYFNVTFIQILLGGIELERYRLHWSSSDAWYNLFLPCCSFIIAIYYKTKHIIKKICSSMGEIMMKWKIRVWQVS